jgi:ABC-2 type transport system ATP-binding protein
MTALVSLSQVTKKFRDLLVLRDIDLTINPGVTGLLGPNGAGKSTLIKVLMGLVRVTSGTGTVLGYPLGRGGRQIRGQVGYVPEDDCYIPGMSGVEVVEFAASLSGLPGIEALRRAHEILDFCGVKQERYRSVESYSTGMRQKVKFAASIVHDPEYLILDEPTSGLDPEEREALLNRVKVLAQKSGKSVLLSTHILPDVQSVCDHVIILSRGEIKLNKSFEEINRPSEPTVTVSVLENPVSFLDGLSRANLRAELLPTGEFTVFASDHDVAASVWRVAQNSGAVIQSLRPARNSLEEVFLNAVQESTHANS